MTRESKDLAMAGRDLKILTLGGDGREVTELMNISGKSETVYTDLPMSISGHCVVNLHKVTYCIGGCDNDLGQDTKND